MKRELTPTAAENCASRLGADDLIDLYPLLPGRLPIADRRAQVANLPECVYEEMETRKLRRPLSGGSKDNGARGRPPGVLRLVADGPRLKQVCVLHVYPFHYSCWISGSRKHLVLQPALLTERMRLVGRR